MTTILTLFHNGDPVGRCDESCYDAIGSRCRCICGGLNHGRGHMAAVANAARVADYVAHDNHGTGITTVRFVPPYGHSLFPEHDPPKSCPTPFDPQF